MTIVEFLTARIAEDEAECGGGDEPENWCDRATGVHYDPARVLREVEAKRAIVWLHGRLWNDSPHIDNDALICREDREEFPCETLCHLATVYADHQDYREEWKR